MREQTYKRPVINGELRVANAAEVSPPLHSPLATRHYLTPTTSGYGINASHIPATWSFMMMARPRIRAADMSAVGMFLLCGMTLSWKVIVII
jgi:hypothetical protein